MFILISIMPETRPREDQILSLYYLYEFFLPVFVSLIICIPTTLAIKQQDKYQRLSQQIQMHKFDVAIFILTPIFANLLAETFSCSGFNTLICCGLFNGVYTRQNLDHQKDKTVQSAVHYIAYLMRHISYLLIGLVVPFIIYNQHQGFYVGYIGAVLFVNIFLVAAVHGISSFLMPKLMELCQSRRSKVQAGSKANVEKLRTENRVQIMQVFAS